MDVKHFVNISIMYSYTGWQNKQNPEALKSIPTFMLNLLQVPQIWKHRMVITDPTGAEVGEKFLILFDSYAQNKEIPCMLFTDDAEREKVYEKLEKKYLMKTPESQGHHKA